MTVKTIYRIQAPVLLVGKALHKGSVVRAEYFVQNGSTQKYAEPHTLNVRLPHTINRQTLSLIR